MPTAGAGLGNQAVLTKIDKLRELSVGAIVPLPQLIVVGDQSSGKSSVLESLTGFSFPRAAGLCTRYATQITCCREPQTSINVSIIPRPDAEETLKTRLLQFQRRVSELDNEHLAKIFEEANEAMGLRMNISDDGAGVSAFSQDILKIEISGPDQAHLTVIDVPGIFRVPTPGLTTENDVTMVRNMVQSYMSNSRTIILAVIPCNVDIATQEILKLAEAADPNGVRTMGVLTKPDLATENTTQNGIIELVRNKRNILTLGYCVVKNRSADDTISTMDDRLAAEMAFFTAPPWSSVSDRCGVASLQVRLRELLMEISRRELPHVKADIERRLHICKSELEAMGPSRSDQSSQRLYLGRIGSRFQSITQQALNGYYTGDPIFKSEPNLKLATRAIKLNEALSNVMLEKGHKRHYGPRKDEDEDEEYETPAHKKKSSSFEISLAKYPELSDIVHSEDYECPEPLDGPIIKHVMDVYESSRGPEVGTFGGAILATVFEEQSEKWEPLVISHTCKAILLVHDYIFQLFTKLCPEAQVRSELWDGLLLEKLRDAYRRAMRHTNFHLNIERRGRLGTLNRNFSANLQKERSKRISESFQDNALTLNDEKRYIPVNKIGQCISTIDNSQQVCEDIATTLMCYYDMSRERLIDAISQQVVNHFLLDGDESPLSILSPEFAMSLDPDQLEIIAGEDAASKRQRQTLAREIHSLEAATRVLRV
ncbi:interferon-induced GTP-binding protein Mx2 [Jackrogersella minutella]|nr:interferon-induced GTP-binding protein Mx2 [Jackrogersella minutella]